METEKGRQIKTCCGPIQIEEDYTELMKRIADRPAVTGTQLTHRRQFDVKPMW